jgi:hypothetical protein
MVWWFASAQRNPCNHSFHFFQIILIFLTIF